MLFLRDGARNLYVHSVEIPAYTVLWQINSLSDFANLFSARWSVALCSHLAPRPLLRWAGATDAGSLPYWSTPST